MSSLLDGLKLWLIIERCNVLSESEADMVHCTVAAALDTEVPTVGSVSSSYKNVEGEEVIWLVQSVQPLCSLSELESRVEVLTISARQPVSFNHDGPVLSVGFD